MHFYKISVDSSSAAPVYAGTQQDAMMAGRLKVPRADVIIDEIEIATDKAGVLALLKGEHIETVVKSFRLTVRGGLHEVEVEK